MTALEFRLYPISEVYAGALFFPWERASEVLQAWREWIRTVPDEVTSVGRIMQFPPLDLVPEGLRGKAFAIIHAYSLGSEAEGCRAAGPTQGARAGHRHRADGAARRAQRDAHGSARSAALRRGAPGAGRPAHPAIDDFVAAAGPGSGSTLVSVEVRHVGGALGRGGEGHGALDKLPGEFVYFGIGMAPDELEEAATRQGLERVTGALRPYRSGSYLNFEEEAADAASFFGEETYRRLRAVKADGRPGRALPGEPPDPARG